jgi:hypothetical protein
MDEDGGEMEGMGIRMRRVLSDGRCYKCATDKIRHIYTAPAVAPLTTVAAGVATTTGTAATAVATGTGVATTTGTGASAVEEEVVSAAAAAGRTTGAATAIAGPRAAAIAALAA